MSFGLSIKTVTGELLLDENWTVPAMQLKPTVSWWATHTPDGAITKRADEYRFSIPAGSDEKMFMFTMPELAADCWLVPRFVNPNGLVGMRSGVDATHDSFIIYRPSTTSQAAAVSGGVPEVYIFGTAGLAPTGEAYGLRVYKADGTVAFDIGYQHLQMAGELTLAVPPTGAPHTTHTTPIGVQPAKPAYFFAPYGAEVWVRRGTLPLSDCTFYEAGYRRSGTNIEAKLAIVGTTLEDLPFVPSVHYGKAPLYCPTINAALFD